MDDDDFGEWQQAQVSDSLVNEIPTTVVTPLQVQPVWLDSTQQKQQIFNISKTPIINQQTENNQNNQNLSQQIVPNHSEQIKQPYQQQIQYTVLQPEVLFHSYQTHPYQTHPYQTHPQSQTQFTNHKNQGYQAQTIQINIQSQEFARDNIEHENVQVIENINYNLGKKKVEIQVDNDQFQWEEVQPVSLSLSQPIKKHIQLYVQPGEEYMIKQISNQPVLDQNIQNQFKFNQKPIVSVFNDFQQDYLQGQIQPQTANIVNLNVELTKPDYDQHRNTLIESQKFQVIPTHNQQPKQEPSTQNPQFQDKTTQQTIKNLPIPNQTEQKTQNQQDDDDQFGQYQQETNTQAIAQLEIQEKANEYLSRLGGYSFIRFAGFQDA